jgi:hypothetical protein
VVPAQRLDGSAPCGAARIDTASKVALARNRHGAPPDSRARASRLRRRCSCSPPPALASRLRRAIRRLRPLPPLRECRAAPSTRIGSPCGRALTARPPDSRARERRPGRRVSSSPPPALASRRPAHVRWRRARPRLLEWRWLGNGAPCHAQASLPTKSAPPVKRRFESGLARRLLPLSTARAYAQNAQPESGARTARRSRRVRQTPSHVHGDLASAARGLRRPCSRSRPLCAPRRPAPRSSPTCWCRGKLRACLEITVSYRNVLAYP